VPSISEDTPAMHKKWPVPLTGPGHQPAHTQRKNRMKIVRLFLMSSLAFLALCGVASAAEVPAASSSPSAEVTAVSTTLAPEGSLTTYSDGVQLFTPVAPMAISDCPSTYFCLWEHANFSGRRLQFASVGYWQSLQPYGFLDQASSFYNNRGNVSYINGHTDGSGLARCHQAGGAGNFGADWNDRARAVYVASWASC
jgi:Peptidase inhibitor family I36